MIATISMNGAFAANVSTPQARIIGWIVSHAAMQALKPRMTARCHRKGSRELVEPPDQAGKLRHPFAASPEDLAQRAVVRHEDAARLQRRRRGFIQPHQSPSRPPEPSKFLVGCPPESATTHYTPSESEGEVKNNTFSLAGKRIGPVTVSHFRGLFPRCRRGAVRGVARVVKTCPQRERAPIRSPLRGRHHRAADSPRWPRGM